MTYDLSAKLEGLLEAQLTQSDRQGGLAVAVSGGSDSLAACHIAANVCRRLEIPLRALTVDHGLRPEAADEALKVKNWLQSAGIEQTTLKWQGPFPKTGIQKAAREARYNLLFEECNRLGISRLLLGHQLEDQLETLLMRLSKGSGVQGLAAMQSMSQRGKMSLLRPFLTVSRAELREYLTSRQQEWIDDPSNENPAYTRTQLGSVLQSLIALPGSNMEALALSSTRLQRAEQALETMTQGYMSEFPVISPFGFVSFRHDFYRKMPEEIAIRFLQRLFIFVRGDGVGPSLSILEKLLSKIRTDRDLKTATLYGCQFRFHKGDWMICREPGRKGLPIMQMQDRASQQWDDRYVVLDHGVELQSVSSPGFEIRKIGEEGWRILRESDARADVGDLPAIVKKNLPAIWSGDKLASVPLFSYDSKAMGIAQGRFEMVFNPKCNLL